MRQLSLVDYLNAGVASPLFQFGAGVFGGARQGDTGQGVIAGASAASDAHAKSEKLRLAHESFLNEQQNAQRKAAAEKAALAQEAEQKKLFLESLGSSGVPKESVPFLSQLSPEAGAKEALRIQQEARKVKADAASTGKAKVMNVDGNLAHVQPDGTVKWLYKKPPDFIEQLITGGDTNAFAGPGNPQPGPAAPGAVPPSQAAPGAPPAPGGPPPQAAPAPGAQLFLQSAPGNMPPPQIGPQAAAPGGGDPFLQRVVDNPVEGARPGVPQPDPNMVKIPGIPRPLTRQQAEQLKAKMLLDGKQGMADLIDETLNPPPPPGTVPGKEALNQIDVDILNSTKALDRLNEIKRQFKPRYQHIDHKLAMWGLDWADSFSWSSDAITPEQRKELSEFHAYRQSSIDNINRYIKEITGAQMSEAEAKRLRAGVPDAGDGPFSGDNPAKFESKMNQVIRQAQMARIRMGLLKKQGFSPNYAYDEEGNRTHITNLPEEYKNLDKIEQRLQRRSDRLFQDAISRGLNQSDAALLTRQQLSQEFGVDI